MRYKILIAEQARDDLRALSKDDRKRIGSRIDALQEDLFGTLRS
jgi:mRNA-degrading endonuclease RelE of RelBE toxin-antitoxin system